MVNYQYIPYVVISGIGIENESEFNALIERECGADVHQQYAFMCNQIQKWLQTNNLRFVLAEITDRYEMAKFMCFAADYIDAFDYPLQDMILDHAYHFGGKMVEAAEQKMSMASLHKIDLATAEPSFRDVMTIKEEEMPDYETILTQELESFTGEQLFDLMTTVFGRDEYSEDELPEIEDCMSFFEVVLDENGWSNDVLTAIVSAIQGYKQECMDD